MKFLSFIFFISVFISGCDNYDKILQDHLDITPPSLISIKVTEISSLTIESNEKIILKQESYISRENIGIKSILYEGNCIKVIFNKMLTPGKQYRSEFRIEDENGNSLSFITNFYGYNPIKPKILINEFITKGSKTNPNKIELYVKEGGNMAGLTLFNGTKNNYDSIYIFPSIDVLSGEYIVIRTISKRYPKPFIEIMDLNIGHDKKFIEGVRDLRINNFKLSGTNGVISLYSDPYGNIMDAVIYSKNRNDDTKRYRNFGLSKTLSRVDDIASENAWTGDYDTLFPDDVIYCGSSTSTRSLNRLNLMDNNNKNDWITVQTREASFGFQNSENEY